MSTRSLRPWMDIVDSPAAEAPGTPGSALCAKNNVINEDLKRSLIACSWRLLMAGLVSHLVTKRIRICFPEINPLMSGDPSALVEKLMIDAPDSLCVRNSEDSKASNLDSTLPSLVCRLNVKYHVQALGLGSSSAAAHSLADMKKNLKTIRIQDYQFEFE